MKKIGIPIYPSEKGFMTLNTAYYQYFNNFGKVVFLTNHLNAEAEDLDLLVLPGGADVLPMRYGAMPAPECQKPNIHAEYFDLHILPKYLRKGTPIFGICRGFQSLNVIYGGRLSQHIDQEDSGLDRSKKVDKHIILDSFNDLPFKRRFDELMGKDKAKKYETNSLHHQGIFLKDLGPEVKPLMINSVYENVEAIWIQPKDNEFRSEIAAVQWHPEEIWDVASNLLIQHLLK